jgi:adenine-specific DNA-methyltransferase
MGRNKDKGMKTENFSPRQALNKAFLRVKPSRSQVEKFQTHLRQLLGSIFSEQ